MRVAGVMVWVGVIFLIPPFALMTALTWGKGRERGREEGGREGGREVKIEEVKKGEMGCQRRYSREKKKITHSG